MHACHNFVTVNYHNLLYPGRLVVGREGDESGWGRWDLSISASFCDGSETQRL